MNFIYISHSSNAGYNNEHAKTLETVEASSVISINQVSANVQCKNDDGFIVHRQMYET